MNRLELAKRIDNLSTIIDNYYLDYPDDLHRDYVYEAQRAVEKLADSIMNNKKWRILCK